jgi:hypothetical protein
MGANPAMTCGVTWSGAPVAFQVKATDKPGRWLGWKVLSTGELESQLSFEDGAERVPPRSLAVGFLAIKIANHEALAHHLETSQCSLERAHQNRAPHAAFGVVASP